MADLIGSQSGEEEEMAWVVELFVHLLVVSSALCQGEMSIPVAFIDSMKNVETTRQCILGVVLRIS